MRIYTEDQIETFVNDNDFLSTNLMYDLIVQARQIFFEADSLEDFCIQSITSSHGFVFGGLNRLLWSIDHGFRPDKGYCSRQFLAAWEKNHG